MEVRISQGNSKMGAIPSVSLPSIKTCIKCECNKKCYANKLERIRPSVRKSYQSNLDLLRRDSYTYWREIEGFIMMNRFFRFHVSGDIPDADYFERMVQVAKRQPHCQILCFTKKYDIVNGYIRQYKELAQTIMLPKPEPIPDNLHIIFSGWTGLEMKNPYNLPEAHVRFKDGTTTAREDAIPCGGNCTDCAKTDGGCWTLKKGEQVVFNEH